LLKRSIELLKGKLEKPKLKHIVWNITERCNSRCGSCDIWRQPAKGNDLTFNEIVKIFEDPGFKDLEEIILTGGEITLRKDLKEIVTYIDSLLPKVKFSLSTNALLPDVMLELVEHMLQQDIAFDVGVSIDAIGDMHDVIRGVAGNFAKVHDLVRGLNILRDRYDKNFHVAAGQTISMQTIDHIKAVKAYAHVHKLGYLPQLMELAPYYHNSDNIIYTNVLSIMGALRTYLKPSLHLELIEEFLFKGRLNFNCYALRSWIVLMNNGDVVPCLVKSDLVIGNLKERMLKDLLPLNQIVYRLFPKCGRCVNSWATGWSMKQDFLPFIPHIAKALIKRGLAWNHKSA